MKRFTFLFTTFYLIVFVSGIDSIIDKSVIVALLMIFVGICLVAVCATVMTEQDFEEYTGWNRLKRWANS